MRARQFSLSAVGAAGHRAMHQRLEGGGIFADPLARDILDDDEWRAAENQAAAPAGRPMRLFMAARSRLAEDTIAAAVARGVRQAVVLGAGLDTFSLRNPHAGAGLRVFEVDHPETQASKMLRLERIAPRPLHWPRFVPVDFETQRLGQALDTAGFDDSRPAVFMWLGVIMYLTTEAARSTLAYVGGIPGAEIVFDYTEPLENYTPARRAPMVALAERLAQLGEPWLSLFDPPALAAELQRLGFVEMEDLDLAAIAGRFPAMFAGISPSVAGPHVMIARNFAAGPG